MQLATADLFKELEMPYQPFNYANIPAQGAPWLNDFVENLAKGYKAGNLPAELKRQAEKENTANQMAALLLQEEPEKFGADLAGKKISNAMAQLLYQQQPEKFRAEMGSTSSQNSARQAQVRLAELQYDPAKYAAYINGLRTELGKSMGQTNPAPQQQMPGELSNQTPIAWGQGNTPMANAPQQMEAPQPNPSSFKNEDFINALIRKQVGLPEVSPQTPAEKLRDKKEFEDYKQKIKGNSSGELTPQTVSKLQLQNNSIDQSVRGLKKLLNTPSPDYNSAGGAINSLDRDLIANYDSAVNNNIDLYSKAQNYLGIKDALHKAETVLRRKPFETEKNYKKRLGSAIDELEETARANNKKLNPSKGNNVTINSSENDPLGLF